MKDTHRQFRSETLGNERDIWFREPDTMGDPLNLVIFLDGDRYRDGVGATEVIDELEVAGEIDDALFVFVSHQSDEARWRECPCYPPFAQFVAKELLPWIQHHHPAIASAKERVLVGLSYTGLAAAYVAFEQPNLFTRVISQSGSFWSEDCWLAKQVENLDTPMKAAFFLNVGAKETATNIQHKEDLVQEIAQIEGVERFRDALLGSGHAVEYRTYDGGHDHACWRQTLPEALRWALPRS